MKQVHQPGSFFRIRTTKLVEWKQSAFLDGFHSTNYHADSGRSARLGSLAACSVPCTLQKHTQTKPFQISIAIGPAFDVFDLVIRPLNSGQHKLSKIHCFTNCYFLLQISLAQKKWTFLETMPFLSDIQGEDIMELLGKGGSSTDSVSKVSSASKQEIGSHIERHHRRPTKYHVMKSPCQLAVTASS
jgi:hypothetical protein